MILATEDEDGDGEVTEVGERDTGGQHSFVAHSGSAHGKRHVELSSAD